MSEDQDLFSLRARNQANAWNDTTTEMLTKNKQKINFCNIFWLGCHYFHPPPAPYVTFCL